MAAPSLAVLDTFNRANGALGAAWSSPIYSGDSAPTIISNTFGGSSATFFDSYWNAGTVGPDTEVYTTISTLPANGNEAYLNARIQSPNSAGMDCYELSCVMASGADTISIRRVINGTPTEIATRSQTVSAGDSIGLVVLGTGATVTLQAWYKAGAGAWTQLGADIADTNASRIVAAGFIGQGVENSAARLDSFGGGTQTAAAAAAPPVQQQVRMPMAILAR